MDVVVVCCVVQFYDDCFIKIRDDDIEIFVSYKSQIIFDVIFGIRVVIQEVIMVVEVFFDCVIFVNIGIIYFINVVVQFSCQELEKVVVLCFCGLFC